MNHARRVRRLAVLLLALLWSLASVLVIDALCPNACSGHGTCDRFNVCRCYDGFLGHDCARRRCPVAKSWGIVRGTDNAHAPEECAGRGTCAYETGTCRCQQGFSGNACQFVDCPDGCFSHGKCMTMQDLAASDVMAREVLDGPPLRYDAVWDADILQGCRCDPGYYGASCGLKRCPVGDDPLTTGQKDEVQLLTCATTYETQVVGLRSDAPLTTGTFLLSFGRLYTRPISYQALGMLDSAGTSVGNALLATGGVAAVTVTRRDLSPTEVEWELAFPSGNPRHSAVVPRWKVLEVQQFVCAADTGTFALTFGNQTIRGIPYNADVNTFKSVLGTIPMVDTIDVSLSAGATSVCSVSGTTVTLRFTRLWHRDFVGDLPPMAFSGLDAKNLVSLFLNGVPGFIDAEAKELVQGRDTCRVVEVQRITCAATSGKFALTFEDGSRITDIPFGTPAAQLRLGILAMVPYVKDLDVTYSDPSADAACTTAGNVITLAFAVVTSTGARGDGDLAEVAADQTNGGAGGLAHIANRLQLAAAFTEVTRGAACVALDQTFAADPANQLTARVVSGGGGGGGSFTVGFRGATTAPIPARAGPEGVKRALERLPTIQGVDVAFSGAQACETPANVMQITFTQNFANLPTVVVDGAGLVPGSAIGALGGPAGAINDLKAVDGTKESDVCANRGLCDDTKLGRCYCFLGYTNSNGRGELGTLAVNRGDCGAPSRIPVACPGDLACSGHGTCSGAPAYRCACAAGWQGGDCSERVCAAGLSWFDYPIDHNVAHQRMQECSGVGTCDRSTGLCKCPRPYTGTACELMLCGGTASECSGNGQCLPLNDLARLVTVRGERAGFTYGDDPNDPRTWDRAKIRSCLCDPGYFGYDCSLRECPRGDDPSTDADAVERQLVQCLGTAGSFTLTYRDRTSPAIPFSASVADVKRLLETSGVVAEVSVSIIGGGTTACASANALLVLDLVSELGDVPPMRASGALLRDSVNGNGQDGSGTIVVATGGQVLLGVASVKGSRENALCSRHGTCDFATGLCACDAQYGSSNGRGGPGPIGDCGYHFVGKAVTNE